MAQDNQQRVSRVTPDPFTPAVFPHPADAVHYALRMSNTKMAFSQTQVPVARTLTIRVDGDGWIRLSHNLRAFVDPARAADADRVGAALRAGAVPAGDEGRGGDHGPDVHWWGGVRSAYMLCLLNGLGGRLRSTYLGRGA